MLEIMADKCSNWLSVFYDVDKNVCFRNDNSAVQYMRVIQLCLSNDVHKNKER